MRRMGNLLVVMLIFVIGLASPAMAQDEMFWEAYAEEGDVIMLGSYSEIFDGFGNVDQRFEVKVWGAPANTRLEVAVNGHVIGVMITNDEGFGKFEKEKFDVPVGGDGRPNGPKIDTGDFVSVGRRGRSLGAEFMPV